MATLLVTRRMSPELRARVEASVRGRRATPGQKLAPRSRSWLRLGLFTLVAVGVGSILLLRRQVTGELDQQRGELSARLTEEAAAIRDEDRKALDRARIWIERSALEGHAEDFLAVELSDRAALERVLSRPTVYVRGSLDGFRNSEALEESAALSAKDAFVLCLLKPPAARTEKALLGRARTSYGGGSGFRDATKQVERLHAALVVLPFFEAAFAERVASAEGRRELDGLQRLVARAPFEAGRRALAARQLLWVMDEPADTPGPTELDGERPHPVRVGLVDLEADRSLLRLRRRVDPRWLSDAARAEYASAVDSCSLALDVRKAVDAASSRNPG